MLGVKPGVLYAGRATLVLAIVQLLVGVVALFLQVALTFFHPAIDGANFFAGYWCGIFVSGLNIFQRVYFWTAM